MVSTRCVVVSAGGSTVSARRRRYLSWRTHPASRVLALGASVGASRVRVESKQRSTSSALQRASRRARGRGRTLVEAVHGTLTGLRKAREVSVEGEQVKVGPNERRAKGSAHRTRRNQAAGATWRHRQVRADLAASGAESIRASENIRKMVRFHHKTAVAKSQVLWRAPYSRLHPVWTKVRPS